MGNSGTRSQDQTRNLELTRQNLLCNNRSFEKKQPKQVALKQATYRVIG
jgi:hypothetical protein